MAHAFLVKGHSKQNLPKNHFFVKIDVLNCPFLLVFVYEA